MDYQQTSRILAIDTKLGSNEVMLTELEGEDTISRTFLFKITIATDAPYEQVKDLLGSEVTLWFGQSSSYEDGAVASRRRPLHGIIRALKRGQASVRDMVEWSAEVVPALWFLSCTSDCRIFQEKTVPDIVKDIIDLHGLTNYRFKLTGTHQKLEYCVQYRESALNFISRLMEEAGIFFWHEHEESSHTLVISDDNGSTPAASFPALEIDGRGHGIGIHNLDEEFFVRSGKWTMRDFNFETPTDMLEVSEPTTIEHGQMKRLERYDYPGRYQQKGAGREQARRHIEQEEARFHVRTGEGGVAAMNAGLRVTVADVENPEVLITSVRHSGQDRSHWTTSQWRGREPQPPSYTNSFACIPKKTPFRPACATPKPFVRGPQTAIVTGPAGEEIYTDRFGRVKAQFHWDRLGKRDESTTCWIRVSQAWAGTGYGFVQIPRIGQEVIVDFLEGDPDRPIITGRVYNADQMPPHALPGAAVKSGLKSNSTKGGGGSNEFTFDDTKGKEQVYLHAQYNMDSVIDHDETRHVKNNLTMKVDGTHTETIKKDTVVTITEGHYTHSVNTGTAKINVKGAVTETFQNTQDTTVTNGITITSKTSFVHVKASTDIVLEVGASKIALYSDGRIEIKGKAIAINGSDAVNVSGMSIKEEAGNDHSISGAIVKSSGSVSNTVQGTMVMLNP